MTNEAEVLEFFEKSGWTIVDLAELGFAQQIAWFAGAEAIAGIHGSGMTNSLWCTRSVIVLNCFATNISRATPNGLPNAPAPNIIR